SMGCHLTVENSLLRDNPGSGLDLFQGTATLRRSRIENTAPNMPQAAIHGHSDGTPGSLVVDSNTIGPGNGTAILLDGSGYVLTNNFIIDNTGWALIPLVDGGRFQFNTVVGNLRAVQCATASTTFPLEDSIFANNDKMGGGPGSEFNGNCPRWNSIDSTSVNQP